MNITVEEDVEPKLLVLHEHWGEFRSPAPPRPEFDHGALALIDMKPESPKIKMPVAEDAYDPNALVLPPDDSLTTEILKHNIRLNKHIKEVSQLLKNLEQNPADIQECPPMPIMAKSKRTERPNPSQPNPSQPNPSQPNPNQPETSNAAEKQRLRFQLGRTQSLPAVVDDNTVQKMLEKSVIMILAQVGFDCVERSALLVFVDVLKDMLYKVSLMSHELNQKDVIEGKAAYKDVLEKAFRNVGFSGLDCVKEYFKKTLLAKRKLAHQKSKQLMLQYNQRVAEINKRSGNSSGFVHPMVRIAPAAPVSEFSPSTSTSEALQ